MSKKKTALKTLAYISVGHYLAQFDISLTKGAQILDLFSSTTDIQLFSNN
jgi:hypothetical protein